MTEGIGRFAIFDDAVVEEADLGVNFFVDESCLGKPRSQCVTALLTELNPDVHGSWYPSEEVRSPMSVPKTNELCSHQTDYVLTGVSSHHFSNIHGDNIRTPHRTGASPPA
jgi:hypothetical protein